MLFNMNHPRNTSKKNVSERYFLRSVGNPISRIIRDSIYKTDGEYFIVVKDIENSKLILDSTTTSHIRIKSMTKLLVSPLVGKIDESYDEILNESILDKLTDVAKKGAKFLKEIGKNLFYKIKYIIIKELY